VDFKTNGHRGTWVLKVRNSERHMWMRRLVRCSPQVADGDIRAAEGRGLSPHPGDCRNTQTKGVMGEGLGEFVKQQVK
jgi:hypothetical protein